MSTAIEAPRSAVPQSPVLPELVRFLKGAAVMAVALFISLAGLTLLFQPTPAVMVFGSQERALGAIVQSDGLIVEQGNGFMVGRGERQGFVRDLYAAGALLVLPAVTGGCLASAPPLSKSASVR